ncbi:hypothetical protein A9Q98_08340 [Thalassotalea sp. 42_200_T64]|nr:hypothetical protein A9Q98_08340 [Thalassotalea sp. 42_200_T64]
MCLSLVVFGCATSNENIAKVPEKRLVAQAQKKAEAIPTEIVAQTGTATDKNLDQRQRLRALPNKYLSQNIVVQPEIKRAVKSALTAKANGDVEGARASLEQLAINHPTLSGIKLHLGDIAIIAGQLDKAKDYYQQVISVNSDNYFAYNRLGSLYRQQGSFAQAKANYQAALTSWPAFAEAHLNLAILFDLYIGDKASALHHYKIYQLLSENNQRRVKGWIVDVSAQLQRANSD